MEMFNPFDVRRRACRVQYLEDRLWTSQRQALYLEDELDAQNRKILAVEAVNTGLSQMVRELQAKLEERSQLLENQTLVLEERDRKIRILTANFHDVYKENKRQARDILGYQEAGRKDAMKIHSLEDQNASNLAMLHTTEEALRQQTEKNVALQGQLSSLKTDLVWSRAQLEAVRAGREIVMWGRNTEQVRNLRNQVAGLELALKDAQRRGEGYEAQCRNLTRDLKVAKARIATLSDKEEPESNLAAVTRVLDAVGDRPFKEVIVGLGLWRMLYGWCNYTIPVLQVRGRGRVELVPRSFDQLPLNLTHDDNPLNYGVRVVPRDTD